MHDDIDNRKLNAIVGAAIKALADSGADDEVVGAFAVAHRMKVATILGQPVEALHPPDLLAIVKQAVIETIGTSTRVGSTKTGEDRAGRFNVMIQGRRTSITISQSTVAEIVQSKGNKKQARALMQEIANQLPADVTNRSSWVEERLIAFLKFDAHPYATVQRH